MFVLEKRFTQTDPMPYGPGHAYESAYVYAFNSPLRFVDPSGKRGGECSYCDGDSIEYAHQFLKYKSQAELEALYAEYRTNLPLTGEGSGSSGSDTHEVSMLLPRRTGQAGLPTLAWSRNAFDAIMMIWAAAPKAAKLLQPKPTPPITRRQVINTPKVIADPLARLAQGGGPTVRVVTNLDSAPAIGRALSVSVDDALAAAARSSGSMFEANLPRALVNELKYQGLAIEKTVSMNGVTGTEIRFFPGASKYIVEFFKAVG
jgi:hypothetical protein